MPYQPGIFQPRMRELASARGRAIKLILAAVSVTFFVSEVQRVLSQSPHFLDYLYVALLGSLGIKITAWILVSEKEFRILAQWLDPKDYEPPSEMALILLISCT